MVRQPAVEKLLKKHRDKPSPRTNDPRQLDLIQHIVDRDRAVGFARLDDAIAAASKLEGK